jgi:fatty-acyl-CoA synthase
MSGFVHKTIGQVISETATRYPESLALIHPEFGVRQNYREFYDSCRKVAKGLMAVGIKRGDNVSVWTTNIPEWIYLQFSLGMIGGVLVTVNTNYQSHELEYILKQSDSTTLFLMDSHRDINFYETVRRVIPELDVHQPGQLVSEKIPLMKNVIYIGKKENTPGMFRFTELIKMGENISDRELEDRMNSLDDNDVINMQYTSGTTGFPKGVMLTHHNVVNNGRMVGDVMGMTEHDRLLIQVPLFHCFGCVMSTMNCIYHGSTMVVLEFFDAARALDRKSVV